MTNAETDSQLKTKMNAGSKNMDNFWTLTYIYYSFI